MGCLFGAKLSPHAEVKLVGRWPEQLHALRHAPLRCIYPDGYEEFVRLQMTDDVTTAGAADVALIVTKASKTDLAAQGAARILAADGLAITLQNGIGNLEIIARHAGGERTALGVTMQGASTDGIPGVLRYGGIGPTYLATHPAIDAHVHRVASLFEQAGLETEVVKDVSSLVWGKLAVNAAINPLTALLRVPNGRLLESEWTRAIMSQAACEVAAVATAQRITLPFADAAEQAEQVARRTATNRSSMLQDVLRRVETEIEAICGAVVRRGETQGVETPVNRMLYGLVKALEESYAAQIG